MVGPVGGQVVLPYSNQMCCQVFCTTTSKKLDMPVTIAKNQIMNGKRDNASQGLFQPIRLERVAEKVASQLKKAISGGVLRVGDRLPSERELAEQMGVSRPSIREALQQLELLGILETVHGGGSVVKNLTEQEISKPMEIVLKEDRQLVLEVTEVRAFMEAWAAKQAATNRTEEELELIHGYLDEMERDLRKRRIRPELDFQFHIEIAAATHNTIFVHIIQNIHQLIDYSLRVHREQLFIAPEAQETIFNHHLRVFEAIRNQDAGTAEAAMREHLQFVVREFKKQMLSA
jgi:GntR family transcriptional regulator, transcriptional repressor for pyruvate dehydrogenase complex